MADEVQKVKCPKCGLLVMAGKFCALCGGSLSAVPVQVSAPAMMDTAIKVPPSIVPPLIVPPSPPSLGGLSPQGACSALRNDSGIVGELCLEADQLCVLFEDVQGMIRLRLRTAPGEAFDSVSLTLCDKVTGSERRVCSNRFVAGMREFAVPVAMKKAGSVVWDVILEYDRNGRRCRMEGEWATVAVGRENARSCIESLVVNINTNITTGHASEVHNSQEAADRLGEVLSGSVRSVFDTLKTVVLGVDRAYRRIDLYPCRQDDALPPMPPEAVCDRMTLCLGLRRVVLFSRRVVTFGRKREWNDISLRPPEGASECDRLPYAMISRRHCRFAHAGSEVVISDGGCDERGVIQPSSGGTYFEGERIRDEVRLSASGVRSGRLSFSGAGGSCPISLDVRVLTPGEMCSACPRSDRSACQGGTRPSLLLKRTDGVPESFVALWSCMRLSDVDPSYPAVKIFREGGAFAWRHGRRCGWLVPGMKADDLMI